MKLCFLNANHKATFVSGQCVLESCATERAAKAIVSTWAAGNKEFCSQEQADAALAIEALFLTDSTCGNLRELEASGSSKIKILNRNPYLYPKLKIKR